MNRLFLSVLIMISAAPFVAADDFRLIPPIDCSLEGECYILQYVDHDPSEGHQDFQCTSLSYDHHKGTDFALKTTQQMLAGVNVLASASGYVKGVRNTMDDVLFSKETEEKIRGRECGNGVVLQHDDGWETQYCHMKKGSVRVKPKQYVEAGEVLGQVGLSGRTQFPHVHLSVRKDGEVVDPFDPDGKITCGTPDSNSLWQTPPPSPSGGIVYGGFTDHIASFDEIKSGHVLRKTLSPKAPAIVAFVMGFGVQKGDQFHMVVKGPEGDFVEKTITLEKNQALVFRAIGRRLNQERWPSGAYSATLSLLRNGEILDSEQVLGTIE